MTDKPSTLPQDTNEQPEGQSAPQISMSINLQYVKDLSFEVPGGPMIFQQLQAENPSMNIEIDVTTAQLHPEQPVYEVAMTTKIVAKLPPAAPATADAPAAERPVFVGELVYCAVATVSGAPENILEQILMIEVPRLIFPFVRNILCDVTRESGFPPVVLQPIDFVELWQRKRNSSFAQAAGHA